MVIHIVMGSQGEYSDRSEWVAGCYTDRQRAAAQMLKMQQAQPPAIDYWFVRYWLADPIPLDTDTYVSV